MSILLDDQKEPEQKRHSSESALIGLVMPRVLRLTLKKRWFEMIASGVKKEEYRELKPYWHKRLLNKDYDMICFRNGYAKDSPRVTVEYKGLLSGLGIIEWGAPPKTPVYILRLGAIIQ